MNLSRLLEARAEAGSPVRVGIIGAGKFGTMFLAQARRTRGLHVVGIADLDVAKARANCRRGGWSAEQTGAVDLDQAVKTGTTRIDDDAPALIAHPALDVLIEATGDPKVGIRHCLAAIDHGKHVVMVNVEADVLAGPLLARRAEEAGGRLTITAILLKITAAALKAHPQVNSSIDSEADELVLKHYVNLGVAVDTPRGLVVPVIRDVDEKNIIEISVELTDISERARSGDLGLQDFRASSFTVTNLGGMGTGHFTPVIHHPNTAILGIGRAERRPVWSEPLDDWEPRSILPLSFTFDHRVMDGADGARFMTWIADVIRQPLVLALGS